MCLLIVVRTQSFLSETGPKKIKSQCTRIVVVCTASSLSWDSFFPLALSYDRGRAWLFICRSPPSLENGARYVSGSCPAPHVYFLYYSLRGGSACPGVVDMTMLVNALPHLRFQGHWMHDKKNSSPRSGRWRFHPSDCRSLLSTNSYRVMLLQFRLH